MRKVLVLFGLIFMAFVWWIGTRLSADAIGLAVGVVFGVLAGVPTALLVMATSRHGDRLADDREDYNQRQLASPYQPPVILLGPPAQRQVDAMPAMPAVREAARPARFRVRGEREDWVDMDGWGK
jgi:hypothetical protein